MRHCPKCDLRFSDPVKICRSCGAILEELVESAPPAAPAESLAEPGDWICPACGETVPGSFEVCWKCESQPEAALESEVPADQADATEQEAPSPTRCLACGSSRVIPNACVADQGEYSSGTLSVVVYGNPEALLLKDRLWGACTAVICSDCGHVQLRVANHRELYRHYLRSQG